MNKTLNTLLGLLTAALLASCGGGGGDAGTSPFTGDPNSSSDPTAARLTLLLNATSINNSGAAMIGQTITIVAGSLDRKSVV